MELIKRRLYDWRLALKGDVSVPEPSSHSLFICLVLFSYSAFQPLWVRVIYRSYTERIKSVYVCVWYVYVYVYINDFLEWFTGCGLGSPTRAVSQKPQHIHQDGCDNQLCVTKIEKYLGQQFNKHKDSFWLTVSEFLFHAHLALWIHSIENCSLPGGQGGREREVLGSQYSFFKGMLLITCFLQVGTVQYHYHQLEPKPST